MKELKSLKKQKDNEIKRLTKEVKQKDEDLETATHDNCLKDVVIENLREIIKEQNEMVEKMEEKLKVMEREMENERKKSERYVSFPAFVLHHIIDAMLDEIKKILIYHPTWWSHHDLSFELFLLKNIMSSVHRGYYMVAR